MDLVDPRSNLFKDEGADLFLNFGEEDRAYGFYAQRLLQHREAVTEYTKLRKAEGLGTIVTNKTHTIEVKSFEVRDVNLLLLSLRILTLKIFRYSREISYK